MRRLNLKDESKVSRRVSPELDFECRQGGNKKACDQVMGNIWLT